MKCEIEPAEVNYLRNIAQKRPLSKKLNIFIEKFLKTKNNVELLSLVSSQEIIEMLNLDLKELDKDFLENKNKIAFSIIEYIYSQSK